MCILPSIRSLTLCLLFFGFCLSANSQTVLHVKDFGATGDAVQFSVNTVSNSAIVSVTGTNRFSSADVGKVIEVFRAGLWVRYHGAIVVTQQDTVSMITKVSDGTNLSLSFLAG